MTPEKDRERFSKIMFALAENYPGTQLSTIGLRMRFEALKEYSIEQISEAGIMLMKTHRFNSMPTVGDFIAVIEKARGKISIEAQAGLQANEVLTYFRKFGRTITPLFEDAITRHLMNTRWRYRQWAATVLESDLKWWRKEFTETYMAHAAGIDSGLFLPAGEKLRKIAQGVTMAIPSRREAANVR